MSKFVPAYDWVCFLCGKENQKGVARCVACDCSACLEGKQIIKEDSKLSQSNENRSTQWVWIVLSYLLAAPVLLMLKMASFSSPWIWLLYLGFGVVLVWFIDQLKRR